MTVRGRSPATMQPTVCSFSSGSMSCATRSLQVARSRLPFALSSIFACLTALSTSARSLCCAVCAKRPARGMTLRAFKQLLREQFFMLLIDERGGWMQFPRCSKRTPPLRSRWSESCIGSSIRSVCKPAKRSRDLPKWRGFSAALIRSPEISLASERAMSSRFPQRLIIRVPGANIEVSHQTQSPVITMTIAKKRQPHGNRKHEKYDRLIAIAKTLPAVTAAVAHPCDESSLRGALEASEAGIIKPIFVGPQDKIREVASKAGLSIADIEIVDAPYSQAAAAAAVDLVRTAVRKCS